MNLAGIDRQFINERITWRPNRIQVIRAVISFALAILLWGWVTQREDPLQTEIYSELVITQSLPSSLQIVSEVPPAEVRIRGPQSVLSDTSRANVSLSLDTSSISSPGSYNLPVRASVPGVSDVSVEPSELLVSVEERVNRVFPLTIETDAGNDQSRSVDGVSPEVSQVNVVGPTSAVDRIAKVVLPVTLQQQVSDYQTLITPIAYDASGLPITEVQVTPDSITTRVSVRTRGKAVSVVPNVIGEPADGYTIQQRRALPETILVDGPTDVLNNLLFVNTEPVDVSGRTESFSALVDLEALPEGVTVIDTSGNKVEVRVAIADTAESTQTLQSIPVQVIGLDERLTATIDTPTVSLQVAAPVDILQSMGAADVNVLVNLTGMGPGTYSVQPVVTLPQGATWISNDPTTITVEIADSTDTAMPSPASGTPATPGLITPLLIATRFD